MVTSEGANPVPPVVMIAWTFFSRASSRSVARRTLRLSGITFLTGTLCPPDPKMKDMKKFLDAFEEQLFKFYPALKGHVIRREDYTTADVSRMTRDSAVPGCGGECIGLAQIVGQCGRNKPSPTAPIQGLFYVGVDAGGEGVGTHQAVTSANNVAPIVERYFQTH